MKDDGMMTLEVRVDDKKVREAVGVMTEAAAKIERSTEDAAKRLERATELLRIEREAWAELGPISIGDAVASYCLQRDVRVVSRDWLVGFFERVGLVIAEDDGTTLTIQESDVFPSNRATMYFEALAGWFLSETGIMAPGKSEPVGFSTKTREERQQAWGDWLEDKGFHKS